MGTGPAPPRRSINPFRRFQASPRDLLSRLAPFSLRAPLSSRDRAPGKNANTLLSWPRFGLRVSRLVASRRAALLSRRPVHGSLETVVVANKWRLTRWRGAKGSCYSEDEAPHASGRLVIDDRWWCFLRLIVIHRFEWTWNPPVLRSTYAEQPGSVRVRVNRAVGEQCVGLNGSSLGMN